MKSTVLRVIGLAAVLALAISAAASAHPGIYTVTQRLATGSVTYQNDPTGGGLATTTQYVVSNDGYAVGFTETAGSGTVGGMLNYKAMPTAYRKDMTPDEKRTYGPAQTLLQPHARCEGVPQLDPATGGPNILAWQLGPGTTPSSGGAPVADPYFNYIPWQKVGVTVSGAPAGANTNVLGEDPNLWIPVVKSATATIAGAPAGGVDLAALSTAQDFTSACTAIGGTYRKADVPASIANSLLAGAVAPVQAQVTSLQGQLTTAQGQVTALQGDNASLTTGKQTAEDKAAAALAAQLAAESKASSALAAQVAAESRTAAAEAGRAALEARRLTLTLPARRLAARQPVAMVTGPAGAASVVTLRISKKQATALGLASPVLATVKKPIGADGALLVTLSPGKAAAKALASFTGAVPVTVDVTSGGKSSSATATLTS
jgi:hypothetical protein